MAVKSRTKPKADKSEPAPQPETAPAIVAFKGFDKDLRCRGFQFEVGKTYAHTGEVKACESGFHACEHPLNVFDYYAPAFSRFAEVELSGDLSRHDGDTKIAAGQITIKAELRIPDLVARAIKWVMDRTHSEEGASATGYQGAASATGPQGAASATGDQGAASATGSQGAASATGYQGAASATGYQGAASATGSQGAASATGPRGAASATGPRGAASATGPQGAASATGDQGAASATGPQGAASATGYQGAASATGYQGAASATGYQGRASGADGCALFLVERDDDWKIVAVWAGVVGRDGIKPDTFYTLRDGNPVEL